MHRKEKRKTGVQAPTTESQLSVIFMCMCHMIKVGRGTYFVLVLFRCYIGNLLRKVLFYSNDLRVRLAGDPMRIAAHTSLCKCL